MTTAEEAIEVLNRVHAADPTVLPALIDHRVPCNRALADDPTVQVGTIRSDIEPDTAVGETGYEVGLLGVINGLFGVDDQSWGFIAADYDDQHRLRGFITTPPRSGSSPKNENEATDG